MTYFNADTGIKQLVEPVFTSGTRPGAGIRRCASTSTASATVSTSSTCSDGGAPDEGARLLLLLRRRPRQHHPLRRDERAGSDTIEEWADKTGMPSVSRRWLAAVHQLRDDLEADQAPRRAHRPRGQRSTRAVADEGADGPRGRGRSLKFNLGGVRDMQRRPDVIFVIDLDAEEDPPSTRPTCLCNPDRGAVDTTWNPRPVEYVIPGNDDGDPLLRADRQHARRGDPVLRHRLPAGRGGPPQARGGRAPEA